MIVEKIISTTIDSADPALLYSPNLTHSLLEQLRKRYVNMCFKHMLITEIKEILEHSPAILNNERNFGSAEFHISFACAGVTYDKYEVIPDAKIVEIQENGNMLLKTEYISAILKNDVRLNHYKVGDKVPVRVWQNRVKPYLKVISATVIPFTPLMEFMPAEVHIAENVDLSEVKDLIKAYNKLPDAERWEELLSVHHKPLKDYKLVELDKITGSGYIYRPIDMHGTAVYWREEKIAQVKNDVVLSLVNDMKKRILTMIAIATEYDYKEAKKSAWVKLYSDTK